MKYPALDNFVNGVAAPADHRRIDVVSPLDGSLLSTVPLSTVAELESAVTAANEAQPDWAGLTQRDRSQFFFTYRGLLSSQMEELAELIHQENGKTMPEARAEIDKAMELGYRHPMGPLRLTDLVGLDVRLAIADYLHAEIGEQFRAPDLLREYVNKGRLGKKSGRGFYDWK